MCEAQERNLKIAFLVEQMMGDWKIDLAKIKELATSGETCTHTN